MLKHRAEILFRELGLDLSPEQWGLLLKIAEREGCPQGELADRALRDYPNVTRLLDGLEKRGLIVREPSTRDRRRVLVRLAESGRRLIDEYLPTVIEKKGKYYEGLDERDLDSLRRILAVVEENILKDYELAGKSSPDRPARTKPPDS